MSDYVRKKHYGKFKMEEHFLPKNEICKHSFDGNCECMPRVIENKHGNDWIIHREILNMELVDE